jgi:hypothetical protein
MLRVKVICFSFRRRGRPRHRRCALDGGAEGRDVKDRALRGDCRCEFLDGLVALAG